MFSGVQCQLPFLGHFTQKFKLCYDVMPVELVIDFSFSVAHKTELQQSVSNSKARHLL